MSATEEGKATAVIGYVRVSTMGQVTDGDSLTAQRTRIAQAAAYHGLTFDPATDIEEDAGISGWSTDNRPGFKRAMRRLLSAAPGSVLIVLKLDRLGRNAIDVQETLAVLLDSGVRVISISDGVDSASGMGAALLKLLTSILATFAELEKEAIVTRLQDGRRHAKSKGRANAREASYGLTKVEARGKLVENEAERTALARARELHVTGGLSLRELGAQLLAEGHHPRHAASWSVSVLSRIVNGQREVTKKKKSARIVRARAEFLAEGKTPAAPAAS